MKLDYKYIAELFMGVVKERDRTILELKEIIKQLEGNK